MSRPAEADGCKPWCNEWTCELAACLGCVVGCQRVFPAPHLPASTMARLVIDTDMSIDVDDVGALCAAHALADRGEATILSVLHNSGSPSGAGAISVINHYWGRDHIPIGKYSGTVGAPTGDGQSAWEFRRDPPQPPWQVGPYADELVSNFASPIRSANDAPDALTVFRRTLASAPDNSVTIVSIGYLTNLLLLLRSDADETAPLDGRNLVSRKVKEVVVMGGRRVPSSEGEWNFAGKTEWATICGAEGCGGTDNLGRITNRSLQLLPRGTPLTFVDFETGVDVLTGGVLAERAAELGGAGDSPCRLAYEIFCSTNIGWCAFALIFNHVERPELRTG